MGYAEGYPYFLQEYGKIVWDEAGSSPIRLEDVRAAARGQARRELFRVRAERTTELELQYVRAMAVTGAGGIRKEALVGWVRATSEPGFERSPPGEPAAPRTRPRAPSRWRPKECATPEFTTVAKAGDIPSGELAAFDVGGIMVAIANVDGIFYAFGDTCTHAQCSLAEGDLEGTTVFCPCHGSVFDVTTGAVLPRRGSRWGATGFGWRATPSKSRSDAGDLRHRGSQPRGGTLMAALREEGFDGSVIVGAEVCPASGVTRSSHPASLLARPRLRLHDQGRAHRLPRA